MSEVIDLRPQPGPQTEFLASQADIAFYGGAAGGGKSYGLMLDPLRHYQNKLFGGTIFRRTSTQVRNEGSLWDQSMRIYTLFGAEPRESSLSWRFPSDMSLSFANLEHEKDVLNYQGSEIPWIGFDEVTHFTRGQFFYMLSRNRSTSGVKTRIRATCNPDPDSWVKTFIRWWLDDEGAYPIPERSGKLRWFIQVNDEITWADSPEEIYELHGRSPEIQPKSVTFIAAKLEDNKILMEKDPGYLGNLLAMNYVDRMRLRHGNWNVRISSGTLFRRDWFTIVDVVPAGWTRIVRFWDRAATKPHPGNPNPDWTRGLKMYAYPNGTYLVADLKSTRDTPGEVDSLIKTTASHDGAYVEIMAQQDPGSAGVLEATHFVKMLAGYQVKTAPFSKDKLTRAKPVSSQTQVKNVYVLSGPWNDDFFKELENFTGDGKTKDDIVDTYSGAFNELSGAATLFD